MTKRNVLTGVYTFIVLSLITFVIIQIQTNGNAKAVAQNPSTAGHSTASIQRLSLSQMIERAGKIFRGTVIDFQPGTVSVGGGDLPTVTYRFRVDQDFKGEFTEKDGVKYAEITMLGTIKDSRKENGLTKLSALPKLPEFSVGSDYLLLMTPESEIGLSSPVGLGQGSFEIVQRDKEEWAKNEFNNAGLFNGPVRYSELADQIRKGGNR
jgi:hypothetical protein